METVQTKIKLEDGKYIFKYFEDGTFRCLRYGDTWRDLTGDKAIFSLFSSYINAKEKLNSINTELLEELEQAQEDICSLHCPSVWKDGQEQPHSERCKRISALIKKAKGKEHP